MPNLRRKQRYALAHALTGVVGLTLDACIDRASVFNRLLSEILNLNWKQVLKLAKSACQHLPVTACRQLGNDRQHPLEYLPILRRRTNTLVPERRMVSEQHVIVRRRMSRRCPKCSRARYKPGCAVNAGQGTVRAQADAVSPPTALNRLLIRRRCRSGAAPGK